MDANIANNYSNQTMKKNCTNRNLKLPAISTSTQLATCKLEFNWNPLNLKLANSSLTSSAIAIYNLQIAKCNLEVDLSLQLVHVIPYLNLPTT